MTLPDTAYAFLLLPYILLGIVVVGIGHGTSKSRSDVSDAQLGVGVLLWPAYLVYVVVCWIGWLARKFGE